MKMYMSIFALTFFCWFRIEETLSLKLKNIRKEVYKDGHIEYSYLSLNLGARKTDQLGEKLSIYELHDEIDAPFISVKSRITLWLEAYSSYTESFDGDTNNELQLFPSISATGQVRPNCPIQSATINSLLKKFAMSKNICKTKDGVLIANLTSHCFRRGGAQYRFFYCQAKWTLTAIKAWGGWSKEESGNTLINYLINDYEIREESFGDMASPFRRDRNFSLLENAPKDSYSQIQLLSCSIARMEEKLTEFLSRQERTPKRTEPNREPIEDETTSHPVRLFYSVSKGWKGWLQQWEHGEPPLGPVKLWNSTKRNETDRHGKRSNNTFYSNRKLLAMEFAHFGNDEALFNQQYGNEKVNVTISKIRIQKTLEGRELETCDCHLCVEFLKTLIKN